MLNDNKVFQALENIMFSRAVLQIREKEAEKITIMNDTGNKQKILRLLEITAGAFSLFVAFGWSFFDMLVRCKGKKRQKKKKWFKLSHIKKNHPRDKYEKEYEVDADKRPLFHVTPPIGWMNDPNGFSVYKGQIHLFYQYHPYSNVWGPMHWGHQVSEDMISWKQYPTALAPDKEYDEEGCFSGSAVMTNLGHVLFYTGVSKDKNGGCNLQNQCMAVGDGVGYKKLKNNPVLTGAVMPEGFSHIDFRDPKVWEEDGIYYMLTCSRDAQNKGMIALFSNSEIHQYLEKTELTEQETEAFEKAAGCWKYEGVFAEHMERLGSVWECPDYFRLDGKDVLLFSPPDVQAQGNELHNGNNAIYVVGTYDHAKKQFQMGQPHTLDKGLDFYASQTTELPDGRRILIAWMQSWHNSFIPDGQEWQGMMTIPRELYLSDGRIIQKPVKELEQYRVRPVSYSNEKVEGRQNFDGIKGRTLDMTVTIKSGEFQEFYIDVAKDAEHYTRITYNRRKREIEVDRTFAGMNRDVACIRRAEVESEAERITLRFILDRNSVELFVNDGALSMSTTIYTPQTADGISFFCDGNAIIDIEKFDIEIPMNR